MTKKNNNNKLNWFPHILSVSLGTFLYFKLSLVIGVIMSFFSMIFTVTLSPFILIKIVASTFFFGFFNSLLNIIFSIKGILLVPWLLFGGSQLIPYMLFGYFIYYGVNYVKNNNNENNNENKNNFIQNLINKLLRKDNCKTIKDLQQDHKIKKIDDKIEQQNDTYQEQINEIKQLLSILEDYKKVFYKDKNGDIAIFNDFFENRDMRFNNTCHNDINCNSIFAKNVVSYSDKTLKKNVKPIGSKSALDKIKQLQGVYYHWNSEDSEKNPNIGFIAQEVNKIVPELVNKDNKNNKLAVEYDKMVALLVEAVKEISTTKNI